ncbi:Cytochrome C' [Planctomycetes bacterium K23_9]|uniref:Cytochrome C n=1 Tax=Stieleria marina TaxID=1930275 RepID=A0A517NZB6_9BACT|nr:Cytochrome C' [Planctomycetes bacterium K23_9]
MVAAVLGSIAYVGADERRLAPPKFSESETSRTFFPSLSDAIIGERPTLSALRKSSVAAATDSKTAPMAAGSAKAGGGWGDLISPPSIEDEVKRVKLHYDGVVTTPGAFKGGGYQDARLDLSILAVMFAIIKEHPADVRWKDQAAAARDLLARSAFNCKAGSTQVYNEAKLRKADLQDLVAGSGLSNRDGEDQNDWSMIVDRSPMMEYAQQLVDSLQDATNDAASVKSKSDQVRREAELLAVLGTVLVKEGMDDFDDDDYAALSKQMTEASKAVVGALERGDADAVRKGVGAITQSCDACHEQYR